MEMLKVMILWYFTMATFSTKSVYKITFRPAQFRETGSVVSLRAGNGIL